MTIISIYLVICGIILCGLVARGLYEDLSEQFCRFEPNMTNSTYWLVVFLFSAPVINLIVAVWVTYWFIHSHLRANA